MSHREEWDYPAYEDDRASGPYLLAVWLAVFALSIATHIAVIYGVYFVVSRWIT